MGFILDCFYLVFVLLAAPYVLLNRKLRRGLWARLRAAQRRRLEIDPKRGVILLHCVSVGEVAAAVALIESLERSYPQYQVVVSTTTPQGMETAGKHLPGRALTYFPLDFSLWVASFLNRIAPDIVVLMELEVWPNFLRMARHRRIPVVLANGRLTERSLRRYVKTSFFVRDVFSMVDRYLVQSEEYRERFLRLGVPESKITVAGNIKYDSVRLRADEERMSFFRMLFGLKQGIPVLIGGSTYGEEEKALLTAYRELKGEFPELRLLLAPRQLDRLQDVVSIIERAGEGYVLRSRLDLSRPADTKGKVIVLDSIGELADVYALGTAVFVGGSLVDRGGHNMVEPAALGVPTIFGPHTYNFDESVRFLLGAQAAAVVKDSHELQETVRKLLGDARMRERMGANAVAAVLRQKGAVDKHVEEIGRILQ